MLVSTFVGGLAAGSCPRSAPDSGFAPLRPEHPHSPPCRATPFRGSAAQVHGVPIHSYWGWC